MPFKSCCRLFVSSGNGNKRVGLEAALIFLEINDESLIANDDELVELVLKTTAGQIGKREISEFFRSHCT
jgi:death-on-curing protein